MNLAEKSGLKVILLVKLHDEVKPTFDHLEKVMKHFENDSTIFAYDLFNEPLYFDKIVRDKKNVIKISKRWQKFFRKHAPNLKIITTIQHSMITFAMELCLMNQTIRLKIYFLKYFFNSTNKIKLFFLYSF